MVSVDAEFRNLKPVGNATVIVTTPLLGGRVKTSHVSFVDVEELERWIREFENRFQAHSYVYDLPGDYARLLNDRRRERGQQRIPRC